MARRISAIDLFCGVGGLSHGLMQAGLNVVAGFDIDPRCKYPFEKNIEAPFIEQDVRTVSKEQLELLWEPDSIRLLAGCAPCQPFSPYRRGVDTSSEPQWSLLGEFSRLVKDSRPELVTMENVPRIVGSKIFREFSSSLEEIGTKFLLKAATARNMAFRKSVVDLFSLRRESDTSRSLEVNASPKSSRR